LSNVTDAIVLLLHRQVRAGRSVVNGMPHPLVGMERLQYDITAPVLAGELPLLRLAG